MAARNTVAAVFRKQLRDLNRTLEETNPHYVRCIKPNMSLAPDDCNGALVLRQFNCTGTTECVKLMQVGFPSRAPYEYVCRAVRAAGAR